MAVWFRFTVTLVAFSLMGLARASAEPQILGLIASLEPTSLQCERGQCGAEFTSFCIEQHRKPPVLGTVYQIHDPETLIVEGVREDGQTIRFQASGLLDIASARGRSAIRISVPARFLKDNGLASVRVTVGERATLIPEPNPTAYWVHTDYDIAVAAGPLRNVAAAIIDHGGERTGAALLTARLVNALPRAGRASEAQRDQVWSSTGLSPGASGYALVEAGFDQCYRVTRSGMMSLRQCLGSLHDRLISKLNVDYWEAIDAGS
jgi:hypothetical protein